MKTLDEVIKAHEFCVNSSITGAVCEECPIFGKPDCMIRQDALHYLKEIILEGLYFPKDYLGGKIDDWQAYRKE